MFRFTEQRRAAMALMRVLKVVCTLGVCAGGAPLTTCAQQLGCMSWNLSAVMSPCLGKPGGVGKRAGPNVPACEYRVCVTIRTDGRDGCSEPANLGFICHATRDDDCAETIEPVRIGPSPGITECRQAPAGAEIDIVLEFGITGLGHPDVVPKVVHSVNDSGNLAHITCGTPPTAAQTCEPTNFGWQQLWKVKLPETGCEQPADCGAVTTDAQCVKDGKWVNSLCDPASCKYCKAAAAVPPVGTVVPGTSTQLRTCHCLEHMVGDPFIAQGPAACHCDWSRGWSTPPAGGACKMCTSKDLRLIVADDGACVCRPHTKHISAYDIYKGCECDWANNWVEDPQDQSSCKECSTKNTKITLVAGKHVCECDTALYMGGDPFKGCSCDNTKGYVTTPEKYIKDGTFTDVCSLCTDMLQIIQNDQCACRWGSTPKSTPGIVGGVPVSHVTALAGCECDSSLGWTAGAGLCMCPSGTCSCPEGESLIGGVCTRHPPAGEPTDLEVSSVWSKFHIYDGMCGCEGGPCPEGAQHKFAENAGPECQSACKVEGAFELRDLGTLKFGCKCIDNRHVTHSKTKAGVWCYRGEGKTVVLYGWANLRPGKSTGATVAGGTAALLLGLALVRRRTEGRHGERLWTGEADSLHPSDGS